MDIELITVGDIPKNPVDWEKNRYDLNVVFVEITGPNPFNGTYSFTTWYPDPNTSLWYHMYFWRDNTDGKIYHENISSPDLKSRKYKRFIEKNSAVEYDWAVLFRAYSVVAFPLEDGSYDEYVPQDLDTITAYIASDHFLDFYRENAARLYANQSPTQNFYFEVPPKEQ
jgi:hypothetical protein